MMFKDENWRKAHNLPWVPLVKPRLFSRDQTGMIQWLLCILRERHLNKRDMHLLACDPLQDDCEKLERENNIHIN